jgi:hypothetical protein
MRIPIDPPLFGLAALGCGLSTAHGSGDIDHKRANARNPLARSTFEIAK